MVPALITSFVVGGVPLIATLITWVIVRKAYKADS